MSEVQLVLHGSVAELRLNNPRRLNALTAGMLSSLETHCEELDRRTPEIQGVPVASAAADASCAGADMHEWSRLSPMDFARNWIRLGHRALDRLARLSKPTVAVVSGHAFGGGLELVAACDIRVMAPDAMIALPEAVIGIVPGWSGTQRLARLIPEPVLKEMALFGRRLTADRALQLGFVAEVSKSPLLAAKNILKKLLERSPDALEAAKRLIHAAVGEDRGAAVEALGGATMAGSSDKVEGVSAFLEKRRPDFSGK